MPKKKLMKKKVAVKRHRDTAVIKKSRKKLTKKKAISSKKAKFHAMNMRYSLLGSQLVFLGAHGLEEMPPQPSRLRGHYVIEAYYGNKRVSVGTVMDEPVRRSYPDENIPGNHYHTVTTIPLEIDVQVPAKYADLAHLSKLRVRVFHIGHAPKDTTITSVPVDEKFRREIKLVGESNGVVSGVLPQQLQKRLKEAVKSISKT